MRISRRAALFTGAALAASFRSSRAVADVESKAKGPRYIVQILLSGGIDAIYTTDPKERSEVEPAVDVPYPAKSILTDGNVRLGPNLSALMKWKSRMAVVNGVQLRTANHPTGWDQFTRMRTGVAQSMPSILEIIGAARDGQPLSNVVIPAPAVVFFNQGLMSRDVLRAFDTTSPDDLLIMARSLRKQADTLSTGNANVAANLRQCADFFVQGGRVSRFQAVPSPDTRSAESKLFSDDLQRAAWLIENDLTRGVMVTAGGSQWDTHEDNQQGQSSASNSFFPVVDEFLTQMAARKNAHGSLLDNTLIVMSSEIGRHPYKNRLEGKDHFPEGPYLFLGAGIQTNGGKGGVFGRTGRNMESIPISTKTGRDETGGRTLMLDDLGTTMLHLFGVDADLYGYQGRVLEFLTVG